jgi:hypothetical protein
LQTQTLLITYPNILLITTDRQDMVGLLRIVSSPRLPDFKRDTGLIPFDLRSKFTYSDTGAFGFLFGHSWMPRHRCLPALHVKTLQYGRYVIGRRSDSPPRGRPAHGVVQVERPEQTHQYRRNGTDRGIQDQGVDMLRQSGESARDGSLVASAVPYTIHLIVCPCSAVCLTLFFPIVARSERGSHFQRFQAGSSIDFGVPDWRLCGARPLPRSRSSHRA